MDAKTGTIFENLDEIRKKFIQKKIGRKLIPLTDKQVKELKPLSKRRRKFLLKGKACICGSKKSFKKCCWKKYKKKYK